MIEINISGLQKKYEKQLALDIDSLNIAAGQLCGIVGNNGAGKTTLFRLMLDLIAPSGGAIELDGEKVARSDHWKDFTGSYLDEGFLIDFMTPEEYFYFTAGLYGLNKAETDEAVAAFARFMNDEILGQKKYIRQLSSGNKQKVGIIAAMIIRPKLLILDEPFNYLDPSSQILIRRMLQHDSEARKTTMLVSSHNLNHITGMCNRIILLEKGKVIRDLQLPNDSLDDIEKYFSLQAE